MANQIKKKPATRKKRVEKKVDKDEGLKPYQDEITIVFTLVFCILLVLSNFNMCGKFGVWISHVFFGLFGFMNYIVPFGIFISIAFYLSNRGSKKARRKLISVIALMIVLMALFQIAKAPYVKGTQIGDYYEASSRSHAGGGMVGGTVSSVLCSLFDEIASIVILIGIGLLLCMFISEKLLFAPMGKRGYQKMQEVKEYRRIQREEYERNEPEVPVRRKAKTFTIEREPAKEEDKVKTCPQVNETVVKDGVIKKEKFGRRGRKKTSVDMEEITPSGIDTMQIQRTKVPKNSDSIPVYEEELMNKFNPVNARMGTDLEEFNATFDQLMKHSKEETGQVRKTEQATVSVSEPNRIQQGNVAADKTRMTEFRPADKAVMPKDKPMEQVQSSMGKSQEEKMEDKSFHLDMDRLDPVEAPESYDAIEPVDNVDPGSMKPMTSKETGADIIRANEKDAANAQSAKRLNTPIHETVKATASKNSELNGPDIAQVVSMNLEKPMEIPYEHPSTSLLTKPTNTGAGMSDEELKQTAWKLHQTLESFGVKVTISNVSCGPSVTRYELQPEQGVKVSKITGLADDIKLNLAAADVRIEAPIPGKAAVGIEVPNKENTAVMLRELLESPEFDKHSSNIAFAVGKDIAGKTVVSDIAKMPHLLIAGATGSGKSVCINTLIMSILYKAHPDDVKLIMVDPKVVELSVYNGIPHLLIPVVTDPKKASGALNWAVIEMTERYQKFAELGVRDLKGYNAKIEKVTDLDPDKYKKMPQIVIIVDELADLMMVAPGEVEESICRLAQLARAAGIHLVIATQRPSVNVITGVIKANIPSRIAFSVSSAVDSRTILDSAGAEKLLGKGDMLFYPAGFAKPIRVQGAFVSDQEVSSVVEFLTRDAAATYDNAIVEKISSQAKTTSAASGGGDDRDEYFFEAAKFIIEKDKASIGMLQRVFKIGFNRASRIMDQLYEAGVVGEEEGTKPRRVIMSMEQFENYMEETG